MTASLIIRLADEGDARAIWRVHSRAVSITCRTHYSDDVVNAWTERLKPESYGAVIRRAVVLIAEIDGEAVGFGQIDVNESEIQAVYVVPECEGTGVGTALLSALERHALERGLRELTLKATLNAQTFYAARGWRVEGHDVHKITQDVALTCVAMRKSLPTPTPEV